VLLMMLEVNLPFFASVMRRRASISSSGIETYRSAMIVWARAKGIDDRGDDPFAPDQKMVGVADLLLPQPPGCPVMHEVAHIVFIPENPVNHVGRPGTGVLVGDLLPIEQARDLAVGLLLDNEQMKDASHGLCLLVRAGSNAHAVRL